jgi:negative regulator of sigma E activity
VTGPRTVIVGSALPLLILVGLLGLPPAQSALGLERRQSVPRGTGPPASVSLVRAGTPRDAAREAAALAALRRSVRAGRGLSFSGTQIVAGWNPQGSTTRVLDLVQRPSGLRTATVRDTLDGSEQVVGWSGADGDGLVGLSERALEALADAYQLRIAEHGEVAGRAATVVVAVRDGREAARMWLDDETGLLLRQDVLDRAGRLHRMVAFLELRVPGAGRAVQPAATRSNATTAGNVGAARNPGAAGQAVAWGEVLTAADLDRWRAEGWPCPGQLSEGFVLLDARRSTSSVGGPVLHLTYSDGLSAISVFLQRGHLDEAHLTGLSSEKWGDSLVHVRGGWPELMVWQGGPTVITAVGDAEPTDLRAALGTLPRQRDRGTLDSLQRAMGSALAWFRG